MVKTIVVEGQPIEVPDDASDDEISQILNAPPPAAPAQSAKAPVDSWLDKLRYVDATGANFARGARQGVATVLGLPVDAVNNLPRVANILPGVDGVGPISKAPPFLGSEYIDKALGGFGVIPEPPKPQDAVQRGARRVGQELGAAGVPVGGALGVAAKVGIQGARELPAFIRMMVEPAAVNPINLIRKEASVATGAGLGGATANEIVDPNTNPVAGPIADLFGAIAGAGTVGLAGTIGRIAGPIYGAATGNPNFADRVIRDVAVDEIARAAGVAPDAKGVIDTDGLASSITNGQRVSDTIPNFQESLADRTGNPGIAAYEYGRQAGPNSGAFAQRRADNTTAVDTALSQFEPQGTVGALRSKLDAERAVRLAEAGGNRQSAEEAALAAIFGVTPQSTAAQRGNVVRGALEESRDLARQRTDEAYQAANVSGKQIDPADLGKALDDAVAGLTEVERGLIPEGMINRVKALGRSPEGAGPVDTGILDASGSPLTRSPEPPEPVRMKEATDLLSQLGHLKRAALADPRAEKGGRNAARVLSQMMDAVDGFVGRNITAEERAALDAAKGAKFDEAQAFARQGDPVASALATNEGGLYRARDDRVAGMFVNPQAMDRLFTEADTPAVRAAIRDEVLAKGDTSSAERITRFMDAYPEQIGRFPGLKDELAAAAAARSREAEARAAEGTLQKDLGTDQTPGQGIVGRYLRYGDARAESAMTEVMRSKDPAKAMDDLLSFVKDDPAAVEGARKALWSSFQKSARRSGETTADINGTQPWMPKAMNAFVNDPAIASVAERLYRDNPEHWANIKKIAASIQNVDLRNSAKAPNTSGTPQGLQNGVLPSSETLASRIFAVERGVVSPTFAALNIVGIAARRATKKAQLEAVNLAIDKALLNPDWAATLLRDNNPANRAALARKAKGWLGNEAGTFLDIINQDDSKEGEVKRKIMEENK